MRKTKIVYTIGQMERIPGMTEGAISAVLIMMKKQELAGNAKKENRSNS